MTYGEAWYQSKINISLRDDGIKFNEKKAKRMKRKESIKYYNKKLFDYWIKQEYFEVDISLEKREKIISALMFGNINRYIELKQELLNV